MTKRGGLGGSLLGQGRGSDVETILRAVSTNVEMGAERAADPREIRPNPFQPREEFDPAALAELADSIRANGLLQPLVVRETPDGLELLAGERRQRAAVLAGLDRVPVRVRNVDDTAAAAIALTENLAREDLTPWEEARGLAALRDTLAQAGQKPNRDTLARMVGRSGGAVSESLAIADRITDEVVRLAGLDRQTLTALPKTALHGAAKAPTASEIARLLSMAAGRSDAPGRAVQRAAKGNRGRPAKPWTVTDRLAARGTLSFSLRRRPAEMQPDEARDALRRLLPVIEALRERAGE